MLTESTINVASKCQVKPPQPNFAVSPPQTEPVICCYRNSGVYLQIGKETNRRLEPSPTLARKAMLVTACPLPASPTRKLCSVAPYKIQIIQNCPSRRVSMREMLSVLPSAIGK